MKIADLTASIIPSPGVNTRPFWMLKALVSCWPLLLPFWRGRSSLLPLDSPIICPHDVLHSKQLEIKKTIARNSGILVIAQQQYHVLCQQEGAKATNRKRSKRQAKVAKGERDQANIFILAARAG